MIGSSVTLSRPKSTGERRQVMFLCRFKPLRSMLITSKFVHASTMSLDPLMNYLSIDFASNTGSRTPQRATSPSTTQPRRPSTVTLVASPSNQSLASSRPTKTATNTLRQAREPDASTLMGKHVSVKTFAFLHSFERSLTFALLALLSASSTRLASTSLGLSLTSLVSTLSMDLSIPLRSDFAQN